MQSTFRATVVALALLTALTGVVYPVVVTAIATLAFPSQARGSLLVVDGVIRGSSLVGQSFAEPRYLWGRPSATSIPYDARSSSGSNLGPTNPVLDTIVRERLARVRAADTFNRALVPVELLTASGSGLDPHVSPAAARYQVGRIARARGISAEAVLSVIAAYQEPRTFGVLGEARVNVLRVNLALDSLSSPQTPSNP